MSTTDTTISAETARHVLWHYGQKGGCQPGSFTQRLMETIDAADITNVEILRGAYPELVAAMLAAKLDPDGVDRLKRAAALVFIRCRDEDGPFVGAPRQPLCEACARPMPLDGVA
jgi:hypothetical protein